MLITFLLLFGLMKSKIIILFYFIKQELGFLDYTIT